MSSPHSFTPSRSQPQPIPNARQQQQQQQHHLPPPLPPTASQEFFAPPPPPPPPPPAPASHPSYDLYNPSTNSSQQHLHPYEPPFPPTSLLPIFTLIEDPSTSEHFHPKVHYIFADDPFDPITAFCPQTPTTTTTTTATDSSSKQTVASTNATASKQKHPPEQHRAIIIDMSPDLTCIKSAYSLSPDWQLLNVSLSSAPQSLVSDDPSSPAITQNPNSFSNPNLLPRNSSATSLNTIMNIPIGSSPEVNKIPPGAAHRPPGVSSSSEGLMLTIEGTKVPGGGGPAEVNAKKLGDVGDGGLYELASTFSERMSWIKRVIEFGIAQEGGGEEGGGGGGGAGGGTVDNGNGEGSSNVEGIMMMMMHQQAGDERSSQEPGGPAISSSPNIPGTNAMGARMERGVSARSNS